MAKIHTHYDNLKVARLAPQEVIRAAYKALSQKYHPDKNPGDEKAARIMAILNSAYGTLSDPQRRKEHDEWIAAEEWEIEWLESTKHEEVRDKGRVTAPAPARAPDPAGHRPYRLLRDARWWFSLAACVGLGWLGAQWAAPGIPAALATVLGSKAEVRIEAHGGEIRPVPKSAPPVIDSWAVAKPPQLDASKAPDIHVAAVAQIVLPTRAPDCDTDLHTLAAPNGEAWPAQSGYVEGYPVSNQGDDLQVTLDNSANTSPVFAKLYDLDRRANVRQLFLLPHEHFLVDKLLLGKYEVRYQNVQMGDADPAACEARKALAAK